MPLITSLASYRILMMALQPILRPSFILNCIATSRAFSHSARCSVPMPTGSPS